LLDDQSAFGERLLDDQSALGERLLDDQSAAGEVTPDDQSAVGAVIPDDQSAAKPAPGAIAAIANAAEQSTIRTRLDGASGSNFPISPPCGEDKHVHTGTYDDFVNFDQTPERLYPRSCVAAVPDAARRHSPIRGRSLPELS
jgi:hypothetical protein